MIPSGADLTAFALPAKPRSRIVGRRVGNGVRPPKGHPERRAVACDLRHRPVPIQARLGGRGSRRCRVRRRRGSSAIRQFEALPGAKAFFGQYDGGLYKIEIPDNWNGELALYAHGFVSNAGANGSALRVGNSPIREHLIKDGFAWAASSYRCNGYVPGQGLLDTMALTDLFTKFNGGRAPQRVYLTGTSMGGHVTLLGMHEFPTRSPAAWPCARPVRSCSTSSPPPAAPPK